MKLLFKRSSGQRRLAAYQQTDAATKANQNIWIYMFLIAYHSSNPYQSDTENKMCLTCVGCPPPGPQQWLIKPAVNNKSTDPPPWVERVDLPPFLLSQANPSQAMQSIIVNENIHTTSGNWSADSRRDTKNDHRILTKVILKTRFVWLVWGGPHQGRSSD